VMQITVPGEVNQHKRELLTWGTTVHTDEKVIRSVEEIYSGARHSALGPRLLLYDLARLRANLLVLKLTGIPATA
jgi:hypothetical protein